MTVAPVPDLILDVMAAADPAARTAATTKLERLTPASGDFAASMAESAKSAASEVSAQGASAVGNLLPGGSGHATFVRKDTSDNGVYRKFEAFVLQMFVETMLPQNASDVFGKGTAGTIWRSMLAEQLGNEMAKGNGIGIAKQLAKSRAAAGGEPSES